MQVAASCLFEEIDLRKKERKNKSKRVRRVKVEADEKSRVLVRLSCSIMKPDGSDSGLEFREWKTCLSCEIIVGVIVVILDSEAHKCQFWYRELKQELLLPYRKPLINCCLGSVRDRVPGNSCNSNLDEEIRRRVLIEVCLREIQIPPFPCEDFHLKSGLDGKPFAWVKESLRV